MLMASKWVECISKHNPQNKFMHKRLKCDKVLI